MCRWLAYSGDPISLQVFLFEAAHSLIEQSLCSRSTETPTNGDGFGIGWYGTKPHPGLFRSIRPAWNDFNLRDLCSQIDSTLFLSHVRATSLATVQETNCHPFRYRDWLFVHNGEIYEVEKVRRDLLFAVSPDLFSQILGTTDSEVMFYLAVTFGLESDPLGALARMAGFIEYAGRQRGIDEVLWMTVAATDGKSIYAVRYASDGDAPSLFHSRDMDDVYKLNPQLVDRLGPSTRLVVSEPLGTIAETWQMVPQNSSVRITGTDIEIQPFSPVMPEFHFVVPWANTAG